MIQTVQTSRQRKRTRFALTFRKNRHDAVPLLTCHVQTHSKQLLLTPCSINTKAWSWKGLLASALLIIFFCCPTPCSQVSILSRLTASLVSLFSPDALLPGPSAPTPCAAGTPCCLAAVRERTKHRHQVAGVLPSSGTCHCVEKPTNR
jgi:hypothetical protein